MSLEALFKELGIPPKKADKLTKKGIKPNDLQNLSDEKMKKYFAEKDRKKLKNWISESKNPPSRAKPDSVPDFSFLSGFSAPKKHSVTKSGSNSSKALKSGQTSPSNDFLSSIKSAVDLKSSTVPQEKQSKPEHGGSLSGLQMVIGSPTESDTVSSPAANSKNKAKFASGSSSSYLTGLQMAIGSPAESDKKKKKSGKKVSEMAKKELPRATSSPKTRDDAVPENGDDEFDILASFMTAERKAVRPKPETRKRKKSLPPVLVSNEEPPGFDKLVFMMNDFLVSAGYQEEKEETAADSKNTPDEQVSVLYKELSNVLEATKIDYIDVKTLPIVSIKHCVSKLAKVVKELEKSNANFRIHKNTITTSEKIISFCDSLLFDHVAYFSMNKFDKNLTDFIKQLFDIKYVLESILIQFKDKSNSNLRPKLVMFFANSAERLKKRLPDNILAQSYSERMVKCLHFLKSFCASIIKYHHDYYFEPLIAVIKDFKTEFETFKLESTKKETMQVMAVVAKIYNIIGKESWKTKKLLNTVYKAIESYVVVPSSILFDLIQSELNARTQKGLEKIKFEARPYEAIDSVYQRAGKDQFCSKEGVGMKVLLHEYADYVLTIASNYKKNALDKRIINILLKTAENFQNSYLSRVMYFNFEYEWVMMEFSQKQEAGILRKILKKTKSKKNKENLKMDQLLTLCCNIAVANEGTNTILELLQLEYENYSKEPLMLDECPKFSSKFGKVLNLIGHIFVFVDLEEKMKTLYSRSKNRKLMTLSPLSSAIKANLSKIQTATDPNIFPKVAEYIFLAFVTAIEAKLFTGPTVFFASEAEVLRLDLIELYSIFENCSLTSFVEEIDRLCAVKEFLTQMVNIPEDTIKDHMDTTTPDEPPREKSDLSPNYSYNDQSLSQTGLLRLISRLGNSRCQEYARKAAKKNSLVELPKVSSEDEKLMAKRDKLPKKLSPLPEIKGTPQISLAASVLPEEVPGQIFGVSAMQENQKLRKNKWEPSTAKPVEFTDAEFKQINKDELPKTTDCKKMWRWASDWLVQDQWAYSISFVSKSFKQTKNSFVHKARTRKLVRYRILDETASFDFKEDESVFEYIKNFVLTVGWCVLRKTQLGSESTFQSSAVKDSDSDSGSTDSKTSASLEKSTSSPEKNQYMLLIDEEKAETLIRNFTDLIRSSAFKPKKTKSAMKDEGLAKFKELGLQFREVYHNDEAYDVETSFSVLKEMTEICNAATLFRNNEKINVLSINFLLVLFQIVKSVSDSDRVEPLVWMCYMQNDFANEGENNIFDFGLPYLEIVTAINTILDRVDFQLEARDWTAFMQDEGVESVGWMLKKCAKWLENYHSIGEDVDGFEETVCRLMEIYYYLGDIYNHFSNTRVNVRTNLRKIMQNSIKNMIRAKEQNLPEEASDWKKEDWMCFTNNMSKMLSLETEKYQNDIFIPDFEDPCKNTIIPVLSKSLMVCETALNQNEFDANLLAVLDYYSGLKSMIGEWSENEVFGPKVLASMKKFLPEVSVTAKRLLNTAVTSQYNLISEWIENSKKSEKLLGNGKYTTFYADVFSYLDDFANLYVEIVLQLPASAIDAEIFAYFNSVFRQLLIRFVDLNCEDIVTVEKVLSVSPVLGVNRGKKGKPTQCAVRAFTYEFNDFEETEEEEEEESDDINETEEICRRVSNLYLGLERLAQIEKRVEAKIQSKLKMANFSLSIDKSVLGESVVEITTVLAHKIVFLDLGNTVFDASHYSRDRSNKLVTHFEKVDAELGDQIAKIKRSLHVEGRTAEVLQALFDVYIGSILWQLLGSTRNSFAKDDVEELEKDFELFDLFEGVDCDTNEAKSLRLVLSYLKLAPESLCEFHETLAKRRRGKADADLVNRSSKAVLNSCVAVHFDANEKQLALTPNGILAVIEHSSSSVAKKYLKAYLKEHKKEFEQLLSNKKDLETSVNVILSEIEIIPMVFKMEESQIKSISMEKINSALSVLSDVQKSREGDEAFNWETYFTKKQIKAEMQAAFDVCQAACAEYHARYDPEVYAEVICSLVRTMARFGFLLTKTAPGFVFLKPQLEAFVRKSAQAKYRKLRGGFPEDMAAFGAAQWEAFGAAVLGALHAEVAVLGPRYGLFEFERAADVAVAETLRLLAAETAAFAEEAAPRTREAAECFVAMLKLAKEAEDLVRACAGPEQAALSAGQPLSFAVYQAAASSLPDYRREARKLLSALFEDEYNRAAAKMAEAAQKPAFGQRVGEAGEEHSKYCDTFARILAGIRGIFFGYLQLVPAALHPADIESVFFERLDAFVARFLQINFREAFVVEHVYAAISSTEKRIAKDETLDFPAAYLGELSKFCATDLTIDYDGFDIALITRKLENLRFLAMFLPQFKSETFEQISELGFDWHPAHHTLISSVHNEMSRVFELCGLNFATLHIGESFFGRFLRKPEASNEPLAAELPRALDLLAKTLGAEMMAQVFDSIFASFVEGLTWIMLSSERSFRPRDRGAIELAVNAVVGVFATRDQSVLKSVKLKRLHEVIRSYGSQPEENVRTYRRFQAKSPKNTLLSADDLLRILEHTDSKEAKKFAKSQRGSK